MLKIICRRCKKDLGPAAALIGRDYVDLFHHNAHIREDYRALMEAMREIANYDERSVIENDAGKALRYLARQALEKIAA